MYLVTETVFKKCLEPVATSVRIWFKTGDSCSNPVQFSCFLKFLKLVWKLPQLNTQKRADVDRKDFFFVCQSILITINMARMSCIIVQFHSINTIYITNACSYIASHFLPSAIFPYTLRMLIKCKSTINRMLYCSSVRHSDP